MAAEDLAVHAVGLLERTAYVVLGTVDGRGAPWTSPVYFAYDGLRDFYWSSTETAEHSRNLAVRPRVSLVVFDSTVAPYHGRALYAVGEASVLAGDDVAAALEIYPGPLERGGSGLTVDDVTGSSPWRIYRATASEVWVLCPREPGQPCPLHGRSDDHRARVVPEE